MKKFIILLILGVCFFVLPASVIAQQTYMSVPGSVSASAGGTASVSWGGGDSMPSYGDTFVYCANGNPIASVRGIPGFSSGGTDELSVADIVAYSIDGYAVITIEYFNEDVSEEYFFTTGYTVYITS